MAQSSLFTVYAVTQGKSEFSGRTGLCVLFKRTGDAASSRKTVTVSEFIGFLKLESPSLANEQKTPVTNNNSVGNGLSQTKGDQ